MIDIQLQAWNGQQICPVLAIHLPTGRVAVQTPNGVEEWSEANQDTLAIRRFIGVKDQNDVKIYEGDILRGHFVYSGHLNRGKPVEHVAAVAWTPNRAAFRAGNLNLDDSYYPYEVIGNIYENPELLEPVS